MLACHLVGRILGRVVVHGWAGDRGVVVAFQGFCLVALADGSGDSEVFTGNMRDRFGSKDWRCTLNELIERGI